MDKIAQFASEDYNYVITMRSPQTKFLVLTQEKELALLRADGPDFETTIQYVAPLIVAVLTKLNVPPKRAVEVHTDLLKDVPVAARRYLDRVLARKTAYRFSTYFTWYIKRRLETPQK